MPDGIKDELLQMYNKYYAIEMDHELSVAETIPHMVDWGVNGTDLFVKAKITKSQLSKMVDDSNVCLRDGFNLLSEKLSNRDIPLVIFSAGAGDIIMDVIEKQSKFHPQMKIVANFLEFDKDGNLIGMKGDLVHTFNKNGKFITKDGNWVEKVKGRHNVILFGDMSGDLTMADGIPDVKNCLKIGFLNANFEKLLDPYMDQWDIVLEDDQTMDVGNAIIDVIMK